MSISQKSSAIEQTRAEEKNFALVEKALDIQLEKNPKGNRHGKLTFAVLIMRFIS